MKFDFYRLLPQYWVQNTSTDWCWDQQLRDLILSQQPIDVRRSKYTVKIGQYIVWTANYPYAYGSNCGDERSGLPSISTRKLLRRRIKEIANEQSDQQYYKKL